ncbi:MAG TPA: hypothetical protein VM243_05115, partial [Phycisphaerae bacterium]|nr:hypothetical protein [Phycisphaerae bacterium]
MANLFLGTTDGDWDKPANWSLSHVPTSGEDVQIIPAAAWPNSWDTGPASPTTIASLDFEDYEGVGVAGDWSQITVTGNVTWIGADYDEDLAAFGGKFTTYNPNDMQAVNVGTQAQGDVEVSVIYGGDTLDGTITGTLTINVWGPAGAFTGTATGPIVVANPGYGEPASPYDFSGATISGVDSLTVNGGYIAGGTWPNIQTIVNGGGCIVGGVFTGPVTFKSGGVCGHPDFGGSDEPEFDNTVTFESGAQINEINADGDTVFESASWSLSAQGYWP